MTFSYSIGMKLLMWFGTAMFSAAGLGALAIPMVEDIPLFGAVLMSSFFGGFALACFCVALRVSATIAVDRDGVTRISLTGRKTHIPWEYLDSIEEGTIGQTLTLRDRLRTVKIVVENQITGLDELRSFILDHASATKDFSADRLPIVFKSSKSPQIIVMLVLFGIGAGLGSLISLGQPFTAIGIGVLLSAVSLPIFWHSLRVDSESITLQYVGREKRIELDQIRGIDLSSISAYNQGVNHVISQLVINLESGKQIPINSVRGGTLLLHAALQTALRARSE